MKKFLFILKTVCVCLCISSILLMVGVANLDTIAKKNLFYYLACVVVAVASFVSFKLLEKFKEETK